MTFFYWIGTILAITYGLMTASAGCVQLKVREIGFWPALVMAVLGTILFLSSLLIPFTSTTIFIMTICMLNIQLIAVLNGLHMHGKINIRHHVIRLLFSIVIIVLIVVGR